MAKKKQRKKHSFKYSSPASSTGGSSSQASSPQPVKASVAAAPKPSPATTAIDGSGFDYVKRDLAKVGLLAAIFVGLEIILWYLFGHTSVGTSVYHLIKL